MAADEAHLAAVAASLDHAVAELTDRLDAVRREAGGSAQDVLERDHEVRRTVSRLRTLRRFGMDLCLGRMVTEDGRMVYVGRSGLADRDGGRLLVDWRSPAAEPFFAATHARPMGVRTRRRYRWTGGRITDYWDEALTPDAAGDPVALDEDSALIASLGASRSARMRDVLTTIQADQDAIIRADSRGALVVDGGPGTGKTVVALHRAAYLLHADPRLGRGSGGILVVGPHQPYLAYVADVLPSLGEEGVRTCTLREMVPGGAALPAEPHPEVARLKADAAMADAIEPAVRLYEEAPTTGLLVETPWVDLRLGAADWAEAFGAPDPSTPHNEARERVLEELVQILVDTYVAALEERVYARDLEDGEPDDGQDAPGDEGEDDAAPVAPERLRAALFRHPAILDALGGAWPTLDPEDLVADLWEVPAYLRRCAPHLTPEQVRLLRRDDPRAWTAADLPLLDAARLRLGDPDASRRARRRREAEAAQRAEMDRVVEDLVASDDTEMRVMSMLRVDDLRGALVDESATPGNDPDELAGPFAHIVVDEAQELTDAEWRMLLRRCPSRSVTVVGDRAQARHGFTETWAERLARVGMDRVEQATLSINYRTPEEVMIAAAPVIRAALPDANVPTSVRRSGVPVAHGDAGDLAAVVEEWLAAHDEGVACVIGAPGFAERPRVRSLTPELAKGLEFDLVVLVDPDAFGEGIEGAVDRYVAMTRATQRLVVLTSA
ncbi:RNA polymerase recycling motor ATPase HelR [Nocardioides sp. YIM 152588]|uniref:RNA polymerase recycling motor ATPase HelR n=1 Tax=Nocardioides sp. YIM 152588 TaxID=3158259 RepID=UPI0032E37AF4